MARWLRKHYGIIAAHNVGRFSLQSHSEIGAIRGLTLGHQNLDSLVDLGLLLPNKLNNAFSFTIVRNPYTRLVSVWRYLMKLGDVSSATSFDGFVRMVLREQPRPGVYNACGLSLASPMSTWVSQSEWSGPQKIFYFERLAQAVEDLGKRLGIAANFPRVNVGDGISGPIQISDNTLRDIQGFYAQDFLAFGYDLAPPPKLLRI